MQQVDVISKFLEARKTGQNDEQAAFFARSWAEASELHPEAITKSDFDQFKITNKSDLNELKVEMMSNFRIVYTLGTAIFAASCMPYLVKLFGH